MRLVVQTLAMLLAASSTVAATAQDGWRNLSGDALRTAFSGMQLSDGFHYTHRYRADGTLNGTEMAREVKGQWRVQGQELCTKRVKPRVVSECFEVQRQGHEVRMLQNGYMVIEGRLSPIKSTSH